jgi:Fe-S-cluster-containing hydrogenase component 2
MPKTLKAARPEKCNGCELCVLASQRQLEKVGLEESLIRIFTNKDAREEYPSFCPDIDPRINSIEIEKIKEICPKLVLEIE